MPRLPKKGEPDWADTMKHYLRQSLDEDGTLVGGATNPHTGGSNTNLADGKKAGLMRVAGDLSNTAHDPKVAGLQGNPVSTTTPKHGQVLAWDDKTQSWQPTDAPGFGHAMVAKSVLG